MNAIRSIYRCIVYSVHHCIDFLFPHDASVLALLQTDPRSYAIQHTSLKTAHGYVHGCIAYRAPYVRHALHALKYRGDTSVASHCAYILVMHIGMYMTHINPDATWILTPIPASSKRLRTYGFNQCAYICSALLPLLKQSFPHLSLIYREDALVRRDTDISQSKLNRAHRFKHSDGAFFAHASVRHTYICIIDDIWTTGATAGDAMRACIDAGAHHAVTWAVAH